MSKKYGRQFLKSISKPSTNPPEGFVEYFADSDNNGTLTTLLPDGTSKAIGGGEIPYSDTDPGMDGTASQGSSDKLSRQDHTHPSDTSKSDVSHGHPGVYEPANANIQGHISSTINPHGTTASQVGAVPANAAITAGTGTKISYDSKGLVTAGDSLIASDIPSLDAGKVTSGVFDIARIPASALERLVQVASQAARYALTTATVQSGDTVKQLDTGIMYVVVDTANLANAAGYVEYSAGTAASVPWSGVTSKPTTLSGYGITDASSTTHAHGNITASGTIGTAAGLPVVTGTSGVVTTAAWSATVPASPSSTGAVGTSTVPARSDHSHPSRIATSAPASPVNGDIWMI